jgi:hypothetical protein
VIAPTLPTSSFSKRHGTGTGAFAAYYAATHQERRAAAARLVHVLEAGRRRAAFWLAESFAQLPLDWEENSAAEGLTVWLLRVVQWLRDRYDLPEPPGPKATAALVAAWWPRWMAHFETPPGPGPEDDEEDQEDDPEPFTLTGAHA